MTNKDIQKVQRACTNREVRSLLIATMKNGVRYKLTKSGIIFLGDNGLTVATHFTVSDSRGYKNLQADLIRAKMKEGKK